MHDHTSGASAPPNKSSVNKTAALKDEGPSINNYNHFITPSPFVPYPDLDKTDNTDLSKATDMKSDTAKASDTDNERGSMAAPDQPASATQKKKEAKEPKISTRVLFPTPQSFQEELSILEHTPMPDPQNSRRQQAQNKPGATPTQTHPPTPLASIPSTPLVAQGSPNKRQKMWLHSGNRHEVEAAIINASAPKLFLDPVDSAAESEALMEALAGEIYKNPPPGPKTRKRTTAELAAEDAQAAADERYILAGDERHSASNTSGAANADSQNQLGLAFSRLKTIESIRARHEEQERVRKEEELRQTQAKREQQAAEQATKRETEMNTRMMQAQRMKQQQQQQRMREAQAAQAAAQAPQQQQQHQQAPAVQPVTQQQQMMQGTPQQQHAQISQGQFTSPVVAQGTPMGSSPVMPMPATMAMPNPTSAASISAGSPPRPPSAVSHQQGMIARPMSRQVSHQAGSRQGTPQMVQSTPVMNAAVPNRQMTPHGQMQHQGSPGGMAGTPVMMNGMNTPQSFPQDMTAAQRNQIMMMRARQLAAQQQQQANNQQQLTPEQMQMRMMQQQQGQHTPTPQGHNPQMNQQMMQAMQARQQQQQQINHMMNQAGAQGNSVSPSGMQGQMQGQQAIPNPQVWVQQQIHQLQMKVQQQKQQAAMANGGMVPPQLDQQITQSAENMRRQIMARGQQLQASRQQQHQQQQQQQQQPGLMRPGQGMNQAQMMAAMGRGMPGGGMPQNLNGMNQQQQAQYMQQMQNQRMLMMQQQAQQQQQGGQGGGQGMSQQQMMQMMQQMQAAGRGGGQPGHQMQNMMGGNMNMNGMQGFGGGNGMG